MLCLSDNFFHRNDPEHTGHMYLVCALRQYDSYSFYDVKQVMRLRFDGQPINETDMLSHLEMEDGDSIDVFQQQTGGGYL